MSGPGDPGRRRAGTGPGGHVEGGRLAVIIPARNCAGTLDAAVASALSVDQVAEIIVVDDGSTDETREWNAPAPVQVVRLDGKAGPDETVGRASVGRGPSFARNAGVAATTSPVILFLDADDQQVPATPDPRWGPIDRGADVSVGRVQCLDAADGTAVGHPYRAFYCGSFFITRAAFEAAGRFRENLCRGEDVELLHRLRDRGVEMVWVDDVVLHYRLHPGSLSARRQDRVTGLMAGLRATISRRAAEPSR